MSHVVLELHVFPKTGSGGIFISTHPAPYRLGDEALLKCGIGYKHPDPSFSRVVSKNEQLTWEPAEIHCQPISELNTLPETGNGGRFIGSRSSAPYHIGDTAVLQCTLGYHVPTTSTSTVVFKNGLLMWEPSSIHCNPVQCTEPFIPVHGHVSSRQYFFPNFFTYVCDEGYELNQPVQEYYCMASGNWFPVPSRVTCLPVQCPPLKAPLHGSMTYYDRVFGSVATFQCDRNYIMLQGETKRVCQADGTWSGENVECGQLPCPPMPSSVSAIPLNNFVIVQCDQDRTVNVKCLPTGQWSLQFPYCNGIPTVPMLPKNVPTTHPSERAPSNILPKANPPSFPVLPLASPLPLPKPNILSQVNPSSPVLPTVKPPPLPHPTVTSGRTSKHTPFFFMWIVFGLVIWIFSWWTLKG